MKCPYCGEVYSDWGPFDVCPCQCDSDSEADRQSQHVGPKYRLSDRIVLENEYQYIQISSEGNHLLGLVARATIEEVSSITGAVNKAYRLGEASDLVTSHAIDFLIKHVDKKDLL
jgi:hypothetical protein